MKETCPCKELRQLRRANETLLKEIETLRLYKRDAERLLRLKERDLFNLSRRCAAISETLKAVVKENRHDGR